MTNSEKITPGTRVYVPPAEIDFPQCWIDAGIKPGPDGTVKSIKNGGASVLFDGEQDEQYVLLTNLRPTAQRKERSEA